MDEGIRAKVNEDRKLVNPRGKTRIQTSTAWDPVWLQKASSELDCKLPSDHSDDRKTMSCDIESKLFKGSSAGVKF